MQYDVLTVDRLPSCDEITGLVAAEALASINQTRLSATGSHTGVIELALDPQMPVDAFKAADADGAVRLTAQSRVAILHGLGHLLRDGRFNDGRFTFGNWRGVSEPACPLRGMYLAFHDNYYSFASTAELISYFCELAMWGVNSIAVHLPQVPRSKPEKREKQLRNNRELLAAIKRLGMKVALLKEANNANTPFPEAIRNKPFPDTDPPRRGQPKNGICPSIPQGLAYLCEMFEDYFGEYQDIGIDVAITFPYDAGGCGCDQCWPWGCRGYITAAREMSRIVKAKYPQCQFILPTWCFDVMDQPDGEWEGLSKLLAKDNQWVDYIMADSHEQFPRYPLEHGVPGDLPMVNFAEIAMWGRFPWGGSGANPLPARMQDRWNESGHSLTGGYPYSEGRYDDINKTLFARFFWDRSTTAMQTVRDYIAYEFGTEDVEPIVQAIELLEKTLHRPNQDPSDVVRAYELLSKAQKTLPDWAKKSWRWQNLFLRSRIDYEYVQCNPQHSDSYEAALCELADLNHLQTAWRAVQPPTRQWKLAASKAAAPPPGANE